MFTVFIAAFSCKLVCRKKEGIWPRECPAYTPQNASKCIRNCWRHQSRTQSWTPVNLGVLGKRCFAISFRFEQREVRCSKAVHTLDSSRNDIWRLLSSRLVGYASFQTERPLWYRFPGYYGCNPPCSRSQGLCPVTDSVAALTGGLLGSPNCRSRRKQTSMGCWDQPHCIVLDPVLLPAQASCHLRWTMGALGTISSPVWKLLLEICPPLALPGLLWFPNKWTFSYGLVEVWSFLARWPLRLPHLFTSLSGTKINPGCAFFRDMRSFLFCFELLSGFWGEISKNRFSLHVIGSLEELLLHGVQFPSSLFNPWATHWQGQEIKSRLPNLTQSRSGATPGSC